MSDRRFSATVAEIYDRLLVPLIFEDYARDLAGRVASFAPGNVLEIAAGTGVLTRMLAELLPADVRIVATDLNEPMLKVAAQRQRDARIRWRQADALHLPFEPRTFDVVACQFGVMFFPQKADAFKEVRSVLRPGGHFFFNVWDRISENDFARVVMEALSACLAPDPPDFIVRIPHGYHDVGAIEAELAAADLAMISAETVTGVSRASSPHDVAVAFCHGTPMRSDIEHGHPARLEEATAAAARALARTFGEGAIEGRIQAHVIHCAAPAG